MMMTATDHRSMVSDFQKYIKSCNFTNPEYVNIVSSVHIFAAIFKYDYNNSKNNITVFVHIHVHTVYFYFFNLYIFYFIISILLFSIFLFVIAQ